MPVTLQSKFNHKEYIPRGLIAHNRDRKNRSINYLFVSAFSGGLDHEGLHSRSAGERREDADPVLADRRVHPPGGQDPSVLPVPAHPQPHGGTSRQTRCPGNRREVDQEQKLLQ